MIERDCWTQMKITSLLVPLKIVADQLDESPKPLLASTDAPGSKTPHL
jgi:hypothetical protein